MCDDGDFCIIVSDCGVGVCVGIVGFDCDDLNFCIVDLCVGGVGCFNLVDEGLGCDDGVICIVGEICDLLGECIGGVVMCVC